MISSANVLTGYLGTYSSPQSPGVFRFTIDLTDGSLSVPELYFKAPDCKYLSLYKNSLAAPVVQNGRAGLFLLDIRGEKTASEVFHETAAACHVAQDSHFLYTANYHEGSVLIYEKTEGGLRLLKRLVIAPGAGCHQVLLYRDLILVPCLRLDRVKIFDCSKDFSLVGELVFPAGTGPRHGIFDEKQERLFLVSELTNQLFVYRIERSPGQTAVFFLEKTYEILRKGEEYSQTPASAAIRLSPDERFLYVSTRFADVITVFSVGGGPDACTLSPIQQIGSGGVHPRDILVTPDGRYLLAANRTQGGLVSFPIDPVSGALKPPSSRVPVPEAVSIVLE